MLHRNTTPHVATTTSQVVTNAPTPVVATAHPGAYGATEYPVATAIPQAEAHPMAQAVAQPVAQAVAEPVAPMQDVPVAVATAVPQL